MKFVVRYLLVVLLLCLLPTSFMQGGLWSPAQAQDGLPKQPTVDQPKGTARQVYLPLLINGDTTTTIQTTRSTPQLIDQAFNQGELTADERALYLAYALYEPQSLPAQFHSTVGWYGTQYVKDVARDLQQLNAAALDATQQELSRLGQLAATVCDKSDGSSNTDSTTFRFNYNSIAGGLTIADYITSMETTFDIEVTQYGWAEPPLCSGGDTCSGATNPWGKYPIQIATLGSGLYGYVTVGGGTYTGYIGDNPNTVATESTALASCMVLNDDYSLFYEGAQAALDATTAHEFVHAIQYGYGDDSENEDDMWYESSAAYMEDEVFDDSNSNYFYLWPVITNSLGHWPNGDAPYGISEYSNFLFFRHVAEHYGGANLAGGGEDVMQSFWENVAAGQPQLTAYNNALVAKGGTLNDAYHNFAIAAKFSKACGAGYSAPYCFEEGDEYVIAVGGLPDPQGNITTKPGTYNGSVKNHYATNWVRLPTVGTTYGVTLTNTAAGGELRGTLVCDTGSAFVLKAFPTTVHTGQSTAVNSMDISGCTSVIAVITNQEVTSGNPNTDTDHSYTLAVGDMLPQSTAITIVLDAVPNMPTNLGFSGTLGNFLLDDADPDDGDSYGRTRTFTVSPGSYTVRRNNPPGSFTTAITCTPSGKATVALPQRSATITIAEGDSVTCTYTVERGVTIQARAFNDQVRTGNSFGRRNAADAWLNGWTMTVSTAPTATVASANTAAVGAVSQATFTGLRAGTYTICATLPNNTWVPTTPTTLDPLYSKPCKGVTLVPGQAAVLLFGAYQGVTAAGMVPTEADTLVTDVDNITWELHEPAETDQ